MDPESASTLLRQLDTLRALTPEQHAALLDVGRLRRLVPGEVLLRQGAEGTSAFLVLSGSAQADVDGKPVGPPVGVGECLGELAVLDDAPRTATVIARDQLVVLEIPAAEFKALLDDVPPMREEVTRALSRRLRQVNQNWAQLAVDTDVLLEAYLLVQGSGDPQDRHDAITGAASLLRRLADRAEPVERDRLADLTPAEQRVADLISRGLSNAGVAAELFLSEHTVASHLKHIYVKLGIRSRVALASTVLRSL